MASEPRKQWAPRLVLVAVAAMMLWPACLELQETTARPANRCTACHGSALREGSEVEQAAPPSDLYGNTEVRYSGVGAHDVHLRASSTHGAVACQECHLVPDAVGSPGHADTAAPAEFIPGPLARSGGRTPSYDPAEGRCANTYCHRQEEPRWAAPRSSAEACGTCHGLPPASPHPPAADCAACHSAVVAGPPDDVTIIAPELHVDGEVQVFTQ